MEREGVVERCIDCDERVGARRVPLCAIADEEIVIESNVSNAAAKRPERRDE